jgi:ribosomal protein S27E
MTDEPDKDAILICHRVTDMPIPSAPSEIKLCTGCLERVWVAYSSPKARAVCMSCAAKLMADDPGPHTIAPPTEAQMVDIRPWLKRGRAE